MCTYLIEKRMYTKKFKIRNDPTFLIPCAMKAFPKEHCGGYSAKSNSILFITFLFSGY